MWFLPRDALRFYFAEQQYTRRSAEDIQLSFALQKHGIKTICAPKHIAGKKADDTFASFTNRKLQIPRMLAFCELLEAGFRTQGCSD